MSAKVRVLHLFSGDLWAGAEVMVANLLEQLGDDAAVESIAVGLNDGVLIRRLARRGIETHLLAEGARGLPGLPSDALRRCGGRGMAVVQALRYRGTWLATGLP